MLRHADGFEHYGVIARMTEGVGGGAAWSEVTANWTLETDTPATDDYHMRLNSEDGGAEWMRRIFGVAKQVVGLGYRFKVDDLPTREGMTVAHGALVLAQIRDVSNNPHLTFILGTDGAIVVKSGFEMEPWSGLGDGTANGTEVERSDPCVARGGYHHFEVKYKTDNATGYYEVRVNEVTVLNVTGTDTQFTANAAAAQYVFGKSDHRSAQTAGFGNLDVDDDFAWDDDATDAENTVVDFVGDKGAYWLPPNGDTATADFTKTGSVTSYGAIDEVPPSTADYLSTAAATARTIVGLASLPENVAEVVAIIPLIYVRKEESGAVSMRAGLVSGAEETYGPEDNPSTAFAYLRPGPKTIDPDTGVPWANDAEPELLIERTA